VATAVEALATVFAAAGVAVVGVAAAPDFPVLEPHAATVASRKSEVAVILTNFMMTTLSAVHRRAAMTVV
jgi:hypothetical protein